METRAKKRWTVRRDEPEEVVEKTKVRRFGRKTGISEEVVLRGKYEEFEIMRVSKARAERKKMDENGCMKSL